MTNEYVTGINSKRNDYSTYFNNTANAQKTTDLANKDKSIWSVVQKYDKGGNGFDTSDIDAMLADIDGDRSNGEQQDTAKTSAIKTFINNLMSLATGKAGTPDQVTVGDYSKKEEYRTLWEISEKKLGDGNQWKDIVKYHNENCAAKGLSPIPEDPTKLPTGAKVLIPPKNGVNEEKLNAAAADRIKLQDELAAKYPESAGVLWEASTDELKRIQSEGYDKFKAAFTARNTQLCTLYKNDKDVIDPAVIAQIQKDDSYWKGKAGCEFPAVGSTVTPSTKDLKAEAGKLFKAIDGNGTDEAAINAILSDLTPDELTEIQKIYKDNYDKSLIDAVKGDTSGVAQTVLVAQLTNKGGGYGTDFNADKLAKQLFKELDGTFTWTNDNLVSEIITKANPAEMKQIMASYQTLYAGSLLDKLNSEYGNWATGKDFDAYDSMKAIINKKVEKAK